MNGPNPSNENSPNYIKSAIDKGYDCEIDFWFIKEELFLGHDKPMYKIEEKFLFDLSSKLWIHCKNLGALEFVTRADGFLNGFWHQQDSYTLTTKGFIWTYPNQPTTYKSILVHLNYYDPQFAKNPIAGVCSDFMAKHTI
jgi:hypothetical protein